MSLNQKCKDLRLFDYNDKFHYHDQILSSELYQQSCYSMVANKIESLLILVSMVVVTQTWAAVTPSGIKPKIRDGACCCKVEKKVVIFGGTMYEA